MDQNGRPWWEGLSRSRPLKSPDQCVFMVRGCGGTTHSEIERSEMKDRTDRAMSSTCCMQMDSLNLASSFIFFFSQHNRIHVVLQSDPD